MMRGLRVPILSALGNFSQSVGAAGHAFSCALRRARSPVRREITMFDPLNLDDPATLIHLDEPREFAYWAHVLDVPQDELKKVVDKVGPRAIDVRRHLARARHAEWSRTARRLPPPVQRRAHGLRGDPLFSLIVCCAAAVVTAFGARGYNVAPSDDRTAVQRQHGCEAASSRGPRGEQVRCPDGRRIGQSSLAEADAGTSARPMR